MEHLQQTGQSGSVRERAAFVAGLLIVFAAAGFAMSETWLCWPDILIDTGREVYVPWRLSEGDVLYRDVIIINGPISSYLNAMWFRIFGAGVHQLLWLNGMILAGVLAMLYAGAYRIGKFWGATMGGLAAVGLFVFGEVLPNDCSSFMLPYCHELTHGVALLLAMMGCIWRYDLAGRSGRTAASERAQLRWAGLAGLILGLVFLTKIEVFLAGAAALAVGLGGLMWYERANLRAVITQVLIALVGLVFPAVVAFVLLSLAMPARDAWHGVIGSWAYAGITELHELPFYRMWMGRNDLFGNPNISGSVMTMVGWALWYALLGAGALLVGLGAGAGATIQRRVIGLGFGAAILAAVAWASIAGRSAGPVAFLWADAGGVARAGMPGWLDAGRPMPLVMVVVIVVTTLASWRAARLQRIEPTPERDIFIRRELFALTAGVLGLALMLKMIFFARSWHYGFALGLPAGVLCFALAGGSVPIILKLKGLAGGARGAWILRGVVALALLTIVFTQWRACVAQVLAEKNAWIGEGADRFRTNIRGRVLAEAIKGIRANTPPNITVAAMPEGVFVNYLTRRVNPTRYTFMVPSDLIMFGENNILAAYQAHPPDVLVLIDRNTIEYGAQYFGRDYGKPLWTWITSNYELWVPLGNPPFSGKGFGALVLRRERPAATQNSVNLPANKPTP